MEMKKSTTTSRRNRFQSSVCDSCNTLCSSSHGEALLFKERIIFISEATRRF
jgi:hypothetical protein